MSTNLEQYIYNVLEIYSVSFCTSMVKGSAFFLLKKEGKNNVFWIQLHARYLTVSSLKKIDELKKKLWWNYWKLMKHNNCGVGSTNQKPDIGL